MSPGIRGKLFLSFFALALMAVAATGLIAAQALDDRLVDQAREDLLVRLALLRNEPAGWEGPLDAGLDPLVDQLGQRAGARVTLFAADGTALGDSEEALEGVVGTGAPEVEAALKKGTGSQVRTRERGRRTLYVAARVERAGQVAGVLRLSQPLTRIDESISTFHRTLASSILVALALSAVLSLAAAHRISRGVRSLREVATRLASGDLKVRSRVLPGDELAELGRAFDLLAKNLSTAIDALRSERDLLGGIVRAMTEGLLWLDGGGRISMINPALREMLLLGPDVVGRSAVEVIRHAGFHELLQDAQRAAHMVSRELDAGADRPRRLLVHAVALREPAGLLAVFVDVTEMRRLERARSDFAVNVSHELRTPITAIRGYAETLQGGALHDPSVAANMVEIIHRQSERLSALVEDLLQLSRLEGRESDLPLGPVRVEEVARRAVDAIRPGADRKAMRVTVDVDPSLRAHANPAALEHVLVNLLDNAVKYTPSGGELTLLAQREGDLCTLLVRDTGGGIDAQHLPRIFERFYRVDPGRSRDAGGTGLGLAIVKHLVAAMEGEVSAQSELGQGSTFRVVLKASGPSGEPA